MHKQRTIHIAMMAATALCIAACDEGRIYNADAVPTEEGGIAHFTGEVTGADTWSAGYTLALAGFEDGSEYALISKNIETSGKGGKYDITLSGIPGEVTTIELCAIDRLRRRVATFHSAPWSAKEGTLQIEEQRVDMSMASAIQTEIFNTTCVQCHGGAGYAAAGLDLRAPDSFNHLIETDARKMPGMERVKPGNSTESELYLILSSDLSAEWNYDHSKEVVRQEKLDLIRNWIDNGAKEAKAE